jgi:hypothetical protein
MTGCRPAGRPSGEHAEPIAQLSKHRGLLARVIWQSNHGWECHDPQRRQAAKGRADERPIRPAGLSPAGVIRGVLRAGVPQPGGPGICADGELAGRRGPGPGGVPGRAPGLAADQPLRAAWGVGAAGGRQPGGVAAAPAACGGSWPAAASRSSPPGHRRRPDPAGGGGGRLLASGAWPASPSGPGRGAVLPGGLADRGDRWRAGLQRCHRPGHLHKGRRSLARRLGAEPGLGGRS